MECLIVTGLSGAGKSRSIDVLEDIGFYCVDNIPPQLISKFIELSLQSDGKLSRVAIVSDIRGGELFNDLFAELKKIKERGECDCKILFLDASDQVLIRRFRETRRKHPLLGSVSGTTEEAIAIERKILRPVRENADFVIDTSLLTSAQLKERVTNIFLENVNTGLQIICMSFGFKYGVPAESDLVFDVRCLPNPFYVDELKNQTGLDAAVFEYVMKWEKSQELLAKIEEFAAYVLPLYRNEGKSQLTISIGCMGGRHRSVAFVERLSRFLGGEGYKVMVNHRDIGK